MQFINQQVAFVPTAELNSAQIGMLTMSFRTASQSGQILMNALLAAQNVIFQKEHE